MRNELQTNKTLNNTKLNLLKTKRNNQRVKLESENHVVLI